MTDDTAPRAAAPLVIMDGDADGSCDPSTGACLLPGATTPGTSGSGRRAGGESAGPPRR